MCGIIGYVGARNAAEVLLAGLRRLEYRGYDSSGIALMSARKISVHKACGKLARLMSALPKRLSGTAGIGHTRWATHGPATQANAHPHLVANRRLALVHNGIIENAEHLRERLGTQVTFVSDTDTEVLAHLIASMPGDNAATTRLARHYSWCMVLMALPCVHWMIRARWWQHATVAR